MKAAIYRGLTNVEIAEIPTPKAGPKDVVVRIHNGCICGTDTSEYNVRNSGAILPGRQFGHELSGVIAEVGGEVKGIREGMRVTVNPLFANHGGRRESCMLGGFAEYVLIEDAEIGYNVYPLPDSVSFEEGALVEPFSVGMHGVNLTAPKPADRALILGGGPIGLGALSGMKALGVECVIVSDVSDFRLRKALELGASAVHNPKTEPLQDFLQRHFHDEHPERGMMDAVVDGAGVGPALMSAIESCRAGARISVIALHKAPISVNPMVIMSKELTIRGSMGYVGEFGQVLGFLERKDVDLRPIITHRFSLAEINEALKTAAKVDEAVKVMIEIAA